MTQADEIAKASRARNQQLANEFAVTPLGKLYAAQHAANGTLATARNVANRNRDNAILAADAVYSAELAAAYAVCQAAWQIAQTQFDNSQS